MALRRTRTFLSMEILGERALMAGDLGVALEMSIAEPAQATQASLSETIEVEIADQSLKGQADCEMDREMLGQLEEFYENHLLQLRNDGLSHDHPTVERIQNVWDRIKNANKRVSTSSAAEALASAAEHLVELGDYGTAGYLYTQAGIGYACGERFESAAHMFHAAADTFELAADVDNDHGSEYEYENSPQHPLVDQDFDFEEGARENRERAETYSSQHRNEQNQAEDDPS